MFQTVFLSTISSKLYIRRQVFVSPIVLPAASLARLAAGSTIGLTKYLTLYVQFWAPDDGRKNRLKHLELLTEINKLWNVASCWLYSKNILATHGPMNVKNTLTEAEKRSQTLNRNETCTRNPQRSCSIISFRASKLFITKNRTATTFFNLPHNAFHFRRSKWIRQE